MFIREIKLVYVGDNSENIGNIKVVSWREVL